jgi:MarR family transcriptional regulator, 2-MHQ and catechol-resistance regulon repressor
MEALEILNRSLTDVHHLVRKIRYELANENGLNSSEFELLALLHSNSKPKSIKDVSCNMLLCSQAITKIAKSLMAKGLLTTQKSPADKRVTYLLLTSRGEMIADREQMLREFLLLSLIRNENTDTVDAACQLMERLGWTLQSLAKPQTVQFAYA